MMIVVENRNWSGEMKKELKSRIGLMAGGVCTLTVIVALASGLGVYVGNRFSQDRMIANMPPIQLNAATGSRTKSMSMATGLVDGNVEGLWVLDHVTGNLQCWVLSPRTGQVSGIYRANVAEELAGGKIGESDYMMATGNFFFTGGKVGNINPGQSICYVGDASSGNVVGYGLVYDKQAINRGIVQGGALSVICRGSARGGAASRDQ